MKRPIGKHRGEHPAARGFAAWADRRDLEHDDPALDAGETLGALWRLWMAEHACGTHALDYTDVAA